MDLIDKRILKLLQKDSRMPITKISKLINLSRPSVTERIDRLVTNGVIEKFCITVPPKKIGRDILFYVIISDIVIPNERFEEILSNNDNIIDIHSVTGHANYIIKVATATIEDMNVVLGELRAHSQIETMLVLNTVDENRDLEPIL